MSIETRHFVLFFTNYVLSGFASACFLLSLIWNFPNIEYFLGVIMVMIFGINVLMVFISVRYQGKIIITHQEDGKRIFSLEIDENPEGFESMNEIRFKVVNEDNAE